MSDRDEWTDWFDHDGTHIPQGVVGSWCAVYGHYDHWGNLDTREGRVVHGEGFMEVHPIHGPNVIRYRIRRPKALQQLRDMIETLPAPSRQKEDTHV